MEGFVANRWELPEDANNDFNRMLQAGINTGAIKLDRTYKDLLAKGLVSPPAQPGDGSADRGGEGAEGLELSHVAK